MVNPYTNPNATLTGAASDQELGRSLREQSKYQQGYKDREVEQGMNQAKKDVSMQILTGTPEEAGLASKWAMEMGLLNEQELNGIVQARKMQEAQSQVPMGQAGTPEMNYLQATTGQSNFQEQAPSGLAATLGR